LGDRIHFGRGRKFSGGFLELRFLSVGKLDAVLVLRINALAAEIFFSVRSTAGKVCAELRYRYQRPLGLNAPPRRFRATLMIVINCGDGTGNC
jgi:hypothetical protein